MNPDQPFDPSRPEAFQGSSCVYLLVSQHEAEACKLGITDAVASRLPSLQSTFGPFNLPASHLLRTASRRDALWVEQLLKEVFSGPQWRAAAPVPPAGANTPAPFSGGNGHTEWYHVRALPPMLRLLSEMIACGALEHRMVFLPGVPLPSAVVPVKAAVFTLEERRQRQREREQQHARERQERSETGFAVVREWMEARRPRITSVSPAQIDEQGNLCRTLFFTAPPEPSDSRTTGSDECHPLLAAGGIGVATPEGGSRLEAYVRGATLRQDGSVEAVHLQLSPDFRDGFGLLAPEGDLPRRIWEWVGSL